MSDCRNDVEKVLFSQEEITARCKELGSQIEKDYADKTPIIVALLSGALPFVAELIKNINIPLEIEYMRVSSYNGGTSSSNELKIKLDLECDIEDRDIIIVDDIIDTGLTFAKVKEMLAKRNPNSIKLMAMLDKKTERSNVVDVDYVGFEVENLFVVGFGLDYAEKYRNLPFIGVLKESIYK